MARILCVEEVAEKLHVGIVTVRRYLANGQIPGKKLGKRWQVVESDLDAFLSVNPTKEEPTDLKK